MVYFLVYFFDHPRNSSLVVSVKLSLFYCTVRRKTKQDSFLQVSLLML